VADSNNSGVNFQWNGNFLNRPDHKRTPRRSSPD
jgi:hypothetical protein